MKAHCPEIDTIRSTCNYMIVLLHATVMGQFSQASSIEKSIWSMMSWNVGYLAMPTLFFMSGYLMESGYSREAFREKLSRRTTRLLVPYFVWSFIFFLFYATLHLFFPSASSQYDQWSITGFGSFIIRFLAPIKEPFNAPLWYLRTLMYLTLLYPLLHRVVLWRKSVLLILFLLISIGVSISGYESMYLHFIPWYGVVAYLTGAYFSNRNIRFLSICNYGIIKAISIAAMVGLCVLSKVRITTFFDSFAWDVCFVLTIPIVITFGVFVHNFFRPKMNSVWFDMAFFVYVSHMIVCPAIGHFVAKLMPIDFIGKTSVLFVCFLVCGAFAIRIIYCFLNRIMPRRMLFVIGN